LRFAILSSWLQLATKLLNSVGSEAVQPVHHAPL
jgi:hypothetical protein